MQIQARLLSEDRELSPALENISIELHTPVALGLRAEVWPPEAQVGVLDTFEIFVQPQFLERPTSVRSIGFDEMLISADPGLDMQLIDVAIGTEEEFASGAPQSLLDLASTDGQMLQGDSLLVRLPEVARSDTDALPQLYFRTTDDGEEVPTSIDGQLLTATSHALLPDEVRGAVRYFRIAGEELVEVDRAAYDELPPESQGPVRYFRKVVGLGNQTVFDEVGDTLSAAQYSRLGRARGWVVGHGRLVRLRFAAKVFLHGTKLKVAVRNQAASTPYQPADAADATALRPSQTLSIAALGAEQIVADISVAPNPFTPNGDLVNDVAQIEFSLFKVYAERPAAVRIWALDGRPMRLLEGTAQGGHQRFTWDGKDDHGRVVPPGLYICQIDVDADAEDSAGQRQSHLIAVAY